MLITKKDLQKQLKKVNKRMFRQLPTAEKSCKKQYEINIFVVRDQNMTTKTPTRQMLITIKDLQKQLKKVRKTFRQLPTAQKSGEKQYEIKIFVVSDQKIHSCANANPHKLVEKTIEKWSHVVWGPKC